MAPSTLPSRPRSASKRKQQSSLRRRTAMKNVSYREESSDSSGSDDSTGQDDNEAGPSRASARKPSTKYSTPKPKDTRKRKASDRRMRPSASAKKAKIGQNRDCVEHKGPTDEFIQVTGKKMPWATLPYQILLAVFDYASFPLISDTYGPLPSINWLLQAAFVSKAFAEPALSALYYSPPLTPPSRAKALINHLATQNEKSTFNYRSKIKYLDLEASSTLMHKYAGHDPIDLGTLIDLVPQLRGVGIHLLSDNLRFRRSTSAKKLAGKSAYQQSMFSALQERKVRLREWTWNQSLARQSCSLASLRDIHNLHPYQTLKEISFFNYESGPAEKGCRREDILGEALSVLPNLTGLHFKMSSIVNSRLLPKLPENLRTLEIVDCPLLKSSTMTKFLHSNGRALSQLILDHNHALNLSFLTTLGADCPKLEYLKMDLRYFTTFFTVRDSDPRYASLFQDREAPMWPNSLQRLELFHLRKWSLEMAELFFTSLTQAAESLPGLRQLRIKASLEESGWRERIGFRDKWTERLRDVFERKSAPPNPKLQSIQIFKAFKKQQPMTQSKTLPVNGYNSADKSTVSKRDCKRDARLSRLEISQAANKIDQSDSDAPLSKVRRSTRVKQHKDDIYALSESSLNGLKPQRRHKRRKGPDDSSSEDSAIDDEGIDQCVQRDTESVDLPIYVQGMCDVVDVLIDNLRPTEEQLNEGDFLDDEVSGDEDWNGDDDMPDDGGYAW